MVEGASRRACMVYGGDVRRLSPIARVSHFAVLDGFTFPFPGLEATLPALWELTFEIYGHFQAEARKLLFPSLRCQLRKV